MPPSQEMIEQNVRQGSRVYESGHVLVLGWCYSQRDLEVVWKTLEQVRLAMERGRVWEHVMVLLARGGVEDAGAGEGLPWGGAGFGSAGFVLALLAARLPGC